MEADHAYLISPSLHFLLNTVIHTHTHAHAHTRTRTHAHTHTLILSYQQITLRSINCDTQMHACVHAHTHKHMHTHTLDLISRVRGSLFKSLKRLGIPCSISNSLIPPSHSTFIPLSLLSIPPSLSSPWSLYLSNQQLSLQQIQSIHIQGCIYLPEEGGTKNPIYWSR
jgi:hypothetical protein